MAEQEKILRLECTTGECGIAADNGGRHVVEIAAIDPSLSVSELMPGTHMQNPIGYKGPENEIIGSLVFNCPVSGATNYRVLMGRTGKLVIGSINEVAGIVPELVVG